MNADLLRTLLLSGASVGAGLFVLIYSTRNWFATPLGRVLYFDGWTRFLLLTFLASSRWFDFSSANWPFVIVYFLYGLAQWIILFAFVSTLAKGDRRVRRS